MITKIFLKTQRDSYLLIQPDKTLEALENRVAAAERIEACITKTEN